MRPVATLLLILLALTTPQPKAIAASEDCSTEPSLNENNTLGYNQAPTPMSDDFAMTAPGCVDFSASFYPDVCASPGHDNVVCFTPTNNCDILIQTSTGNLGSSINVFTGACGEPSSCIASAASPGPHYNSSLLYPVSLTANTQYCVVWERCGAASQGITINPINNTDCGPLGILPRPDINGDSEVDLVDVLIGLRELAGIDTGAIVENYASAGVDMDGDDKLGVAEVIAMMVEVAANETN